MHRSRKIIVHYARALVYVTCPTFRLVFLALLIVFAPLTPSIYVAFVTVEIDVNHAVWSNHSVRPRLLR